jgi:hypothetical protein
MSQRSSHTHCQVAQADTQAKTWQRVCLPHPDKIELKKISLPSENKKYPTAQTDTTMTTKLNIDNGLQRQTDRTPAGNSVFATMAGDVGKSSFQHLINFCAGGQVSALKPPQRKYANRYVQPYRGSAYIKLTDY